MIEEFKLALTLSIIKDPEQNLTSNIDAETILAGNMSDLRLRFTPHTYNNFINIDDLLSVGDSSSGADDGE